MCRYCSTPCTSGALQAGTPSCARSTCAPALRALVVVSRHDKNGLALLHTAKALRNKKLTDGDTEPPLLTTEEGFTPKCATRGNLRGSGYERMVLVSCSTICRAAGDSRTSDTFSQRRARLCDPVAEGVAHIAQGQARDEFLEVHRELARLDDLALAAATVEVGNAHVEVIGDGALTCSMVTGLILGADEIAEDFLDHGNRYSSVRRL